MSKIHSIKKQTFSGIIWRGGYHALLQITSLFVKIVLIKLLLPADFGLIAMGMIVFSSLDIVNRFAQGEPFIRDNTSDSIQAKNTLFYINSIFLGVTTLICFVSAPHIALFFGNKISSTQSMTTLVWIIRAFSLRFLFSIPAAVPLAVLSKELRFKELYVGNILGASSYALSAPVLAFLGFGVWAIVLGHLLEQIVITAFFLYYVPFVPTLNFDKKIFKKYIKYNSNIFVISTIAVVITQGDDAIIGRLMGPGILGFYNIGQQFAMFATLVISTNINAIIFPVLSNIQNDKELFEKVFFKTFRMINLFSIPLIGGSVILGKDIVLCFFGELWLPVVPIFYVLSIATVLSVIICIAGPVFMSLNKPHIMRNSQLISLPFFIFLIYPFAEAWGVLGVCWVMVVLSIIPVIYIAPILAKEIDGLYSYILKILSKIVLCTLTMMACVYFFNRIIIVNMGWLFLSVIAGIVIYFILMLFYDKELKNDIYNALMMLKEKIGYKTA